MKKVILSDTNFANRKEVTEIFPFDFSPKSSLRTCLLACRKRELIFTSPETFCAKVFERRRGHIPPVTTFPFSSWDSSAGFWYQLKTNEKFHIAHGHKGIFGIHVWPSEGAARNAPCCIRPHVTWGLSPQADCHPETSVHTHLLKCLLFTTAHLLVARCFQQELCHAFSLLTTYSFLLLLGRKGTRGLGTVLGRFHRLREAKPHCRARLGSLSLPHGRTFVAENCWRHKTLRAAEKLDSAGGRFWWKCP